MRLGPGRGIESLSMKALLKKWLWTVFEVWVALLILGLFAKIAAMFMPALAAFIASPASLIPDFAGMFNKGSSSSAG